MSEPAGPKGTSWTAHATVAVAALGAAWFCLLSVAATIAYTPVGVRPDEIGMDSATVLTQAVAGLIVTLVMLAVLGLIVGLVSGKLPPQSAASLALWLALAIVALAFAILSSAKTSADKLKAGEKGRDNLAGIPIPSPWSAEVVEVFWARSGTARPSSSLPLLCALSRPGEWNHGPLRS